MIFKKASIWACRSAGRCLTWHLGAYELRVTGTTTAVRVFYFLKLADEILVFHAFQKKTHKTPKREMALGQQRLKEVLHGNV